MAHLFEPPHAHVRACRRQRSAELISPRQDHIAGFDYLRVAAALGVVWIHGSDTNALAKSLQTWTAFAVPCFWLMAAFLAQMSCARRPEVGWGTTIVRRVRRLVPAYLGWTAVYLILRLAKRKLVSHVPFDVDWVSAVFCGGASYQLYFVPALLLLTVLLSPVAVVTARRRNWSAAAVGLLLLGAVMLAAGCHFGPQLRWPAGYEMFGYMVGHSGYFPMGMGLWWLTTGSGWLQRWPPGPRCALPVCLCAVAVWLTHSSPWFTPVCSLAVFALAILTRLPPRRLVGDHLAPCAFGIFLSHAVFVEGLQVLTELMNVDIHSFAATTGVIAVSFVCSALLCVGLRKSAKTSWLVV